MPGTKTRTAVEKDLAAVQRLVALCRLLGEHPDLGLPAERLIDAVGYASPNPDSRKDMLGRDIRQLRALGLRIENRAEPGEEARYRLIPGDDRIRISLTPAEQLALRCAAEQEPDPQSVEELPVPRVAGVLDLVQRAVATNAILRFSYSGRNRVVHPYGLTPVDRGGWLCHGWEEATGAAKSFAVAKMRSLEIDPPGTAHAPARSDVPSLDPFRFALDEPAVARLEVLEEYLDEVVANLHEPRSTVVDGPVHRLTYHVTNHRYFTHRVVRLGERVRLVGDDTMRARLRTMLLALVEVD